MKSIRNAPYSRFFPRFGSDAFGPGRNAQIDACLTASITSRVGKGLRGPSNWIYCLPILICASVGQPFSGIAFAASFNCSEAKVPRERLICGDAALSDLDGRLGRLYLERVAVLSASGAALLQKSERNWLHYISVVCPMPTGQAPAGYEATTCLKEAYTERLRELAQAGMRLGPYMFNRIDMYAAEPAPDRESGHVPGFYVQHVAYPQIDAPLSLQAEAWNKHAQKTLSVTDDCGRGDDDTVYDIGYAAQSLISTLWTIGVYCHGTPHGMFSLDHDNAVMTPTYRPLKATDIFDSSSDWDDRLRKLFETALHASGWSPVGADPQANRQNVENYAMEPENWLFTHEGLMVAFGEGIGGCYACNPQPITVRWADLKPLLKPMGLIP